MADQQTTSHNLTIVGDAGQFTRVSLIEPTSSGYLMLALEIDHRPPFAFFLESALKREALKRLIALRNQLQSRDDVLEATVFKALLMPPGKGEFLKMRPEVKIARFDVVLLVEFRSMDDAQAFERGHEWSTQIEDFARSTKHSISRAARNERRIGAVDHSKQGVFLFNYFYADHLEQNLAVWEYTAGWFQQETALDNSVLLTPDSSEEGDYKIINHCRWDRLTDVLPSLLFKRSFHTFVLANFAANATAAMPVLYRRA